MPLLPQCSYGPDDKYFSQTLIHNILVGRPNATPLLSSKLASDHPAEEMLNPCPLPNPHPTHFSTRFVVRPEEGQQCIFDFFY